MLFPVLFLSGLACSWATHSAPAGSSLDVQKQACQRLGQQCSYGWDCCSDCCLRGKCSTSTLRCPSEVHPCTTHLCPPGTACRLHYPFCFAWPCPPPTATCTPSCDATTCPQGKHCAEPASCPKPPPFATTCPACHSRPQCVATNPCKGHRCPVRGTYCLAVSSQCSRGASCPPRPVCIVPPTCEDTACPQGTRCEMRQPPCAPDVPCYPMPNCIADRGCARDHCADMPGYACTEIDGLPVCLPRDPCKGKRCPKHTHCVATYPCPKCPPKLDCVADNIQTCAAVSCMVGYECVIQAGTPHCIPMSSDCDKIKCPKGTHCILEYPVCPTISGSMVKPPYKCPPVARCVADFNPCLYTKCRGICSVLLPEGCTHNSCQAVAICTPKPLPLGPCERQYCPPGSHCEKIQTYCTRIIDKYPVSVLCNIVGTCVADVNPCITMICPKGYQCQLRPVTCVRAPCPPIPECVPEGCLGIDCPSGRCTMVNVPCLPPGDLNPMAAKHRCPDPVPVCDPVFDPCDLVDCFPERVCQVRTRICHPPCLPEAVCVPRECADLRCRLGTHCELRPSTCAPEMICIQIVVPTCVPDQDPCEKCGPGTSCTVSGDTGCHDESCSPIVDCFPDDPCSNNPCPAGEQCQATYPQCAYATQEEVSQWCQPVLTCVPNDPCAQCGPGTTCIVTDVLSTTRYTNVECVPDNPCSRVRCQAGYSCQVKETYSIPQLPAEAECVIDACLGFVCPLGSHCQEHPSPVSDGDHPVDPLALTCVADDDPCARCGQGMNCVPKGMELCAKPGTIPSVECVPKPCSEIVCPDGQVCRSPGDPCEMPCPPITGCYPRDYKG